MYNGPSRTGTVSALIIDRHISLEILRPFTLGLGLLVLALHLTLIHFQALFRM